MAQALLIFSAVGTLILILLTQCRPDPSSHTPAVFFSQKLPDFKEIENVSERKEAFFQFLLPFVKEANEQLLRNREHLELILAEHDSVDEFSSREKVWSRDQLIRHFPNRDFSSFTKADLQQLLTKIDVIPPSLALSQAALESAWGTSRFARQGNNLFGIWCYEPGCGIVPRRRPAGATYEVRAYNSPRDSFFDYMENLNTNSAYEPLRSIRAERRRSGEAITGIALANGLVRYSQEGWTYVDKIQSMIRANNLSQYDTQ